MSYQKISVTIPDLATHLATVAATCDATEATQAAMLASGAAVELDNGTRAWVACVVQDNPDTYATEILTIALALNSDGTVRMRPSGAPLSRSFWHPSDPVTLDRRGLDAVRKDLLLMALGETPLESDDAALTAQWTTERSIRVAVDIADAVAATPTDVL